MYQHISFNAALQACLKWWRNEIIFFSEGCGGIRRINRIFDLLP
jgi:hypothetical protein